MSKIEDLIRKHCPDGVEYKTIKESFTRIKGTPITAGKMKEIANANGDVRIYAGGKTVVNAFEKDIPKANITKIPAVLVQSRGVIDVIYYDKPFTFKNEMWAYSNDNSITVKYLYYVLKNNIQHFRDEASGMGSMPQISLHTTEDFSIPVPPLPVQEEIVRILDNFTELEAELEAELDCRKRQYEYYRNKLLSFSDLGGGITQQVKWVKMSEIGTFYGGLTGKSKSDFGNGNAQFISYMNIFSNIAINLNCNDTVKINQGEKQNRIEYGDIIFTGSSETPEESGMSSVMTQKTNVDYYLNSFCFGFRLKDKSLFSPDFSKHLFRSKEIRKQIVLCASGVTRFNVSKKRMEKILVPIPSIEYQLYVADILDKFNVLVNDLSTGLPAEINARRKQYEYYRNRLLTFKEKTA